MTEKRFELTYFDCNYITDHLTKVDYPTVDGNKMDKVVEILNELYEENNQLKEEIQSLTSNLEENYILFKREKTGTIYFTFNSPESTIAITQYLLTREKLTVDAPLFDISYKYMSDLFKETNDQLGLGKNGPYSRFASHMLRRYHATQLTEAGMDLDKINILQGRKPKNIAYQSYIKIKPSKLKDEYIEALPYLVVEDYTRVKTELETVKEENRKYEENLQLMWEEINNIKKRESLWNELKMK